VQEIHDAPLDVSLVTTAPAAQDRIPDFTLVAAGIEKLEGPFGQARRAPEHVEERAPHRADVRTEQRTSATAA
jgi:hypothetical protein